MTGRVARATYTRTTDHLKDVAEFIPNGLEVYQFCGTEWDLGAHVPGAFRALSP